MSSSRGLMFVALLLPALFLAYPARDAEAAAAPQITGLWSCMVTRPGSAAARPLDYVFHSDGIVAYSSQTTINGGPASLPFTSRGGGNGQWQKIGPSDFAFQVRENMYINGNAGGFFYADATLHLDTRLQQLCSGRPECPTTQIKVRLTQFTFGVDGSITGEVDLLPANSVAQAICSPLTVVFTGLP
jgi:hypothetical protein